MFRVKKKRKKKKEKSAVNWETVALFPPFFVLPFARKGKQGYIIPNNRNMHGKWVDDKCCLHGWCGKEIVCLFVF